MNNVIFANADELMYYACVLQNLAKIDNDYSQCEKEYIDNILKTYSAIVPNACYEEIIAGIENIDIKDAIEEINKNQQIARFLLRDLIILGNIDGVYSEEERCWIANYASLFNMSIEDFSALEKAIATQFSAQKEIDLIICKKNL